MCFSQYPSSDCPTHLHAASPQKDNATPFCLTVLQSFGYDIDRLGGAGVHSLTNVMILDSSVRGKFDELFIWFEKMVRGFCILNISSSQYKQVFFFFFENNPQDTENHYRIDSFLSLATGYRRKETVTFSSPHAETLPVPCPKLLALHAACAKATHLSGVGEYIGKHYEEMEDLQVLAHDGSSSTVLEQALYELSPEARAL